jgi:hypothetical protein
VRVQGLHSQGQISAKGASGGRLGHSSLARGDIKERASFDPETVTATSSVGGSRDPLSA